MGLTMHSVPDRAGLAISGGLVERRTPHQDLARDFVRPLRGVVDVSQFRTTRVDQRPQRVVDLILAATPRALVVDVVAYGAAQRLQRAQSVRGGVPQRELELRWQGKLAISIC